jgi:YegS/Rv2252/BmrU family lipid kinase
MVKSILAIINPISGYARSRELPALLRQRLRQAGFHPTVYVTTGPADAYEQTRNLAREFDLVLACGGDGTVRDVVAAAAPSGVPVTILPSGTENLFAKQLGIRADLDRVVETIKWGRIITMDMAMVNGRGYLMLSGVGFDAEVLLHLNSFRTGNITHLTYFWPIWRTFWEHKFSPVTIEADGKTIVRNEPGLAFVSNISRYAVGLRICQRAIQDDGLLDVCFYRCRHQIPLLMHAWRTVLKRHLRHPDVVYHQARQIKVTSPVAMPYQTDGDPAGYLPAVYTVVPGAAKVMVPPA